MSANPVVTRNRILLALSATVLIFSLYASASMPRPPGQPSPVENEAPVPESYFGLHIHRAVPTARFPVASAWPDVGFYGWRLWDSAVAWPSLEPSRGQWSFGTLDSIVGLAEREHAEILLPLGLSPAWASARPEEASAYGPGNAAPPRDIEDWKEYVRAVATRYRGRITHYEIWNEPNLPRFFSGSVEEMLMLAREARAILKEADPANVVVSPAATSGEVGLKWLEAYLGAGGGAACDVVGFHFYTGGKRPETIRPLALHARRILAKANLGPMPLWNTETGWNIPSQVPSAGQTPNAQRQAIVASWVSRALISGWASGLDRFYWYAWDNFTMGLTEADGKTEKPAATAYRVTRQWLVGNRMKDWCLSSTGIYSVTLERPDGGLSWLVWMGSGSGMFQIPTGWKISRLEDLAGNTRTVSDLARAHGISVGESPLLLVGIHP
jgi:hypothetical protein